MTKAKVAGYGEMYEDMKKNGAKNLYNLAKTIKWRALHIDKMMFIKDGDGRSYVVTVSWREYLDKLLNTKNRRKDLEGTEKV